MAKFEFLPKELFDLYSTVIFDILASNMMKIAPTGNSKKEDYKEWYDFAGKGIKSENRYIVLIYENKAVVGYFQYSVTSDAFVMEDIQLRSEFHGKDNIFRDLYSFVLMNVKADLLYVEAYAHKSNDKSIGILKKLGLKIVGENKNGISFHFKGKFSDLLNWSANRL